MSTTQSAEETLVDTAIQTPENTPVDQETQEQQAVEQDMQTLLAEAQTQANQHYDSLLRLQADMENLRRRTEREIEQARKFALERFVEALIPVVDSMEMGLQASVNQQEQPAFREGMEMTFKLFVDTLVRFNVVIVDPVGSTFNPQEHEAMTMQPSSEHAPNTVMMTIQKGYKLGERVVRPARVIVAKAVE